MHIVFKQRPIPSHSLSLYQAMQEFRNIPNIMTKQAYTTHVPGQCKPLPSVHLYNYITEGKPHRAVRTHKKVIYAVLEPFGIEMSCQPLSWYIFHWSLMFYTNVHRCNLLSSTIILLEGHLTLQLESTKTNLCGIRISCHWDVLPTHSLGLFFMALHVLDQCKPLHSV